MKLFSLLLLFCGSLISAQDKNVIVEYEYQIQGVSEIFREFLVIENSNTYYFGYQSKQAKLSYEDLLQDQNRGRLNNRRLMFNNADEVLYENHQLLNERVISKEKPPKISWTLSKENKMILGYQCTKATSSFRGRNYIVWYTNEIPVNEGPWKLKGLPGIILEANDSDDKFQYIATRVIMNTDMKTPENLVKYFEDNLHKVIDLKEAVKKADKMAEYLQSLSVAEMGKNSNEILYPIRYDHPEFSYEWEEPKKP